jgi:hypothetical protein
MLVSGSVFPRHFTNLSPLRRASFLWETAMNKVVRRIMQAFGMRKTQDEEDAQEELLDFLSKKPGTAERQSAVENVEFLKDLRT